jgi:hypothetical protein
MTNDTYHGKQKYVGNVAAGYDEQRATKPHWVREQKTVAAFVEKIEAGSTVLDVPFGTGRYVQIYLARGLKVRGADISGDMIAAAANRLGDEIFEQLDVRVADAEFLPFGDGAADALVSTRFIKWLPDLKTVDSVIGEFARICSGRLLIQVKVTDIGDGGASGLLTVARHLLWLLRDRLHTGYSVLAGRSPKKTLRYSDADLRVIFARWGLEIIDVFDDEDESRAIRYYILESRY